MDVDSFIRLHEDEWKRLEDACRGGSDALARRPGSEISDTIRAYLRVSTHLTEARSRYADPALERYLNDLVGRARGSIYAARTGTTRGFLRFFAVRYREAIRETTPFIVVAAVLMVVVVLASWAWVAHSSEARLGLIPQAAQDAIKRFNGIRNAGLPPSQALATQILLNNVGVAFLAFALGITVGIGTIWVVLDNALILGVLAGGFGAAGHAAGFWALILPHGLLELTAICISAGAGMRMGWAIVNPGDRARRDALSEEAAAAVIVVLGVIPAFILAAVIEGFITGTNVPPSIQLGIGVLVWASYVCFLFGRWPGRRRGQRRELDRRSPGVLTTGPPT